MTPQPWTPTDIATLKEMRAAGKTTAEISRKIGRSHQAIYNFVSTMRTKTKPIDIPDARNPWTPEMDKQLTELRESGESYKVIAAVLGRSESAVTHRINDLRRGTVGNPNVTQAEIDQAIRDADVRVSHQELAVRLGITLNRARRAIQRARQPLPPPMPKAKPKRKPSRQWCYAIGDAVVPVPDADRLPSGGRFIYEVVA